MARYYRHHSTKVIEVNSIFFPDQGVRLICADHGLFIFVQEDRSEQALGGVAELPQNLRVWILSCSTTDFSSERDDGAA